VNEAGGGRPINKAVAVVIAVAIAIVFLGFVRAIANGDYFGPCDGAKGERCLIVHVFGVVMHRDESEPEEIGPPESG
jgi:hypothetical protein